MSQSRTGSTCTGFVSSEVSRCGLVDRSFAVPVFDLTGAQFAGLLLLLLTVGGTRERGALERAIEQRRHRMRIEIYTVNQLLALRSRAGGEIGSAV